LQIPIGEPVEAFAVALDEDGKGVAIAVLNEREQFVVLFFSPAGRHTIGVGRCCSFIESHRPPRNKDITLAQIHSV
jgi:hypothetical protein